ncbi:unnamed protein product [Hymenolepis diminuta]|uniref:Uncharacterized protein n=1 Tax=Hymenolepis diminuta TaxID=6216 RepID=A0A564Z236_HYMDI|nr:unnamed protein product [Hymenolepis diminuta]
MALIGCEFKIKCGKTTEFEQGDGLSLFIVSQQTPLEETVINSISLEKNVHCILVNSIRNIPVTVAEINYASVEDSVTRIAMVFFKTKWPSSSLI